MHSHGDGPGKFNKSGKWRAAIIAVVFALAVFGALFWTGIIPGSPIEDLSTCPPRLSSGKGSDPSWAFLYDDAAVMSTHSDTIAIGKVDTAKEITGDRRLYMTYWSFKVEEILKGKETGELTVVQMGSPDVPGSDIRADPLLIPGDRYLLFLKENITGVFSFHPQGRFFICKDKVYSMNYILSEGAALPLVPGLNLNGESLESVKGRITGIVDAVQLIFTRYESRSPGDVMGYPAGTTFDAYVNMSTGGNGPGHVTYTMDQSSLPEGITVRIEPAEFDALPYTEYESRLLIIVAPEVQPGSYRIPLEYDFYGFSSGSRAIRLNVFSPYNPPGNDELIERGLKPPSEVPNEQ